MQNPVCCPNCDVEAAGRFCADCGQKQSGRLTLKQLGGEFVARFFNAERGVLKTLVELTVRPGLTARNYLDGKRSTYVSPLFWYALCSASQLLSLWLVSDTLAKSLTDNLPPAYLEHLSSNGIESPKQWASDRYMMLVQSAYSWLGVFTFVLPTSLVLRAIVGRSINLAEALAISLLTIGHVMLITAITAQVLIHVSPLWQGYVSYAIYFGYATLTVGGCFRWKPRHVIAGMVAIVAGGACFFWTLITLARYVLTTGF